MHRLAKPGLHLALIAGYLVVAAGLISYAKTSKAIQQSTQVQEVAQKKVINHVESN